MEITIQQLAHGNVVWPPLNNPTIHYVLNEVYELYNHMCLITPVCGTRGGSRIFWGRGLNLVMDLWSMRSGGTAPKSYRLLSFWSKVYSTFDGFLKDADNCMCLISLSLLCFLLLSFTQNLYPLFLIYS